MIVKAAEFSQNDEDWDKTSYAANMETAGFNEPAERLALGGVFNHLLMFSMLKNPEQIAIQEPAGPVSSLISTLITHINSVRRGHLKVLH